jgi:type I restriction enzyme S subunit
VLASGGGQPNINQDKVANLRIPLPPLPEQRAIVTRIDELRSKCELLELQVVEHITRLREYRSSLISAAVTGQIDMGTFQCKPVQPA